MNYVNHKKTSDIFKSFYKCFYIFLLIFFSIYIKKTKISSAKNYQENEERLQKKLLENTKTFLKKKRQQYDCDGYKNLLKDKK